MKRLNELFDVTYGHKLDLNKMELLSKEDGGINFVGRSSQNHGVSAVVAPVDGFAPYPAGLITVALGGTKLLSSFIQEHSFYTAQNVAVLRPLKAMTFAEKLYVCICIRHNRFRYSAFGREANRTLRELPIPSTIPQWVYDAEVEYSEDLSHSHHDSPPRLNQQEWKWFEYQELFDIERGRGPRKKDLDGTGNVPVVSSSDTNNGWTAFTSVEPIHQGGTIGVNRNGSVAEAFYQPLPFCSTEDVHIYTPKFTMNQYIGLFITTLIRKEKYRYNYGRKWGIARMKTSKIKLPVDPAGNPDFKFMEDYVKSLPFSKNI